MRSCKLTEISQFLAINNWIKTTTKFSTCINCSGVDNSAKPNGPYNQHEEYTYCTSRFRLAKKSISHYLSYFSLSLCIGFRGWNLTLVWHWDHLWLYYYIFIPIYNILLIVFFHILFINGSLIILLVLLRMSQISIKFMELTTKICWNHNKHQTIGSYEHIRNNSYSIHFHICSIKLFFILTCS